MKDTTITAPSNEEAPKWRALRLLPPGMAAVLNNPLYRLFSGIGRNRDEVIKWSGLQPGMDVLELGPGGGYYTAAVARHVGEGCKVYSVDVQKEMIEKVKRNVEKAGVKNVIPLVSDGASLPLPDQSVDFIWALYVFEEIIDLEGTIAEVNRVLRPGGLMSIAQVAYDFKQDQKDAMRYFIPRGGFENISEYDGKWTYRVRYRKV